MGQRRGREGGTVKWQIFEGKGQVKGGTGGDDGGQKSTAYTWACRAVRVYIIEDALLISSAPLCKSVQELADHSPSCCRRRRKVLRGRRRGRSRLKPSDARKRVIPSKYAPGSRMTT
jgi:hypothetical protein